MKAAVLHANEDLRYEDYPTPEVRPGTVLVRVKASGICGSDIPRVLHNGAHNYPIVLGHEFSGVVEQVGEGVTSIREGMRVSGAPLVPCMKCDDCAKGNFSLCIQEVLRDQRLFFVLLLLHLRFDSQCSMPSVELRCG